MIKAHANEFRVLLIAVGSKKSKECFCILEHETRNSVKQQKFVQN
jgi:hypothetical protein